jgi:D-alanine-D-alanine ligase-like ATP-grasp enzyme
MSVTIPKDLQKLRKVFVVVRGGKSHEATRSSEYGSEVLKIFRDLNLNTRDMYMHPNGAYTLDNVPVVVDEVLPTFHFVWIALVGIDGESGHMQELCEKHGVKYVGHNTIHSHLVSDKKNLHKTLKQHGIKSPYSKTIKKDTASKEKIIETFQMVGLPIIVKPLRGSGGLKVDIAGNYVSYEKLLEDIIKIDHDALVEKYIEGKHVSVLVCNVNDAYHTHVYGLDENVEIDNTEFIKARDEALYIHSILGFTDHVEYDFVLSPKNTYLIEANTHPSLTHGLIKKSFAQSAINFKDYVYNKIAHII